MSFLTLIDSPAFLSTITPDQKSRLFEKLEAIAPVLKAGYGNRGEATKLAAKAARVSPQAIHLWVKDFKNGGCEALVDGRCKRGKAKGLPEITRQWIQGEFIRLQREDSGIEIYKTIRERARMWWKTGQDRFAIPGFVDPPRLTAKGYPEGLSEETIRRYGPDEYQRALAHQGRKTASGLLPSIPSSRIGVGYLERIFFDDQMYDHYVRELGYDKPMRPVGFNALDYLTGAFLDFHIRLRWWDTDSETHKSLTQREFVWFVLGLLSSVGYRTDSRGTRLVFEHGTANSWSSESGKLFTPGGHTSFEDALYAVTGGHVTVDRSGKFNKATWSEMMFVPKSAGNFRYKSPIESMFRAVRTHGLLLPGATGRKADLAPEENYGLEREERYALKLANSLPRELAESVRSNLFSFMEYYRAYRTIYGVINADPEHALKDWDKIGFGVREWKWKGDLDHIWRARADLANLAPQFQASHEAEVAADPGLQRVRRMSRAEAVRSCENDPCIRTLDKWKFHLLLPEAWATPVTVRRNREIVIHDALIKGKENLTYFATCRNERGHVINFQPGDKLLCHIDPFRPDEMIVLDQQGVIIGMTPRVPDDVPTNSQIAHELLGERARMAADVEAPVRQAVQSVARSRREVREHNKQIERDVTPAKAAKKKGNSRRASAMTDNAADDAIANAKAPADDTHTDDIGF